MEEKTEFEKICDGLDELVLGLAMARKGASNAKMLLDQMIQEMKQSEAYIQAEQDYRDCLEEAEDIEKMLKTAAIQVYEISKNKKPHTAIEVIEKKTLEYDAKTALDWCKANLSNAVKLDEKLFEKHALAIKDTCPLDFVLYSKTNQVRIASDLSALLEAK